MSTHSCCGVFFPFAPLILTRGDTKCHRLHEVFPALSPPRCDHTCLQTPSPLQRSYHTPVPSLPGPEYLAHSSIQAPPGCAHNRQRKCEGLYVLKRVLETLRGQEETGVDRSGVCRSESHHIVIHSGALGLRCDLPSCGASTSKKCWCPEHLGRHPGLPCSLTLR